MDGMYNGIQEIEEEEEEVLQGEEMEEALDRMYPQGTQPPPTAAVEIVGFIKRSPYPDE